MRDIKSYSCTSKPQCATDQSSLSEVFVISDSSRMPCCTRSEQLNQSNNSTLLVLGGGHPRCRWPSGVCARRVVRSVSGHRRRVPASTVVRPPAATTRVRRVIRHPCGGGRAITHDCLVLGAAAAAAAWTRETAPRATTMPIATNATAAEVDVERHFFCFDLHIAHCTLICTLHVDGHSGVGVKHCDNRASRQRPS